MHILLCLQDELLTVSASLKKRNQSWKHLDRALAPDPRDATGSSLFVTKMKETWLRQPISQIGHSRCSSSQSHLSFAFRENRIRQLASSFHSLLPCAPYRLAFTEHSLEDTSGNSPAQPSMCLITQGSSRYLTISKNCKSFPLPPLILSQQPGLVSDHLFFVLGLIIVCVPTQQAH